MTKSIPINLKKHIRDKDYVHYFRKDKQYVFSYDAYIDYCIAKRYKKIPFYERLDNKTVEVRHSKGGKIDTEIKGLYPMIVYVKPYWCKEV